MADQTAERTTAFAIHDSVNQWLTEPTNAKKFIEPVDNPDLRPGKPFRGATRQNRILPGGERLADARGIQTLELGAELTLHCEGLSGGGASGTTNASTLSCTVLDMLTVLLGGTQSSAGDTTDNVSAGTGSDVIVDGAATDCAADGGGVIVEGTTSGNLSAREVVSTSGDTMTIDRTLTTETGGAESAMESTQIYGMRTLYPDNDVSEMANIALFQSGDNWEFEAFGAAPTSARLVMEEGEILRLVLGGWMATVWNSALTSGALSPSQPTTGYPVICAPMIMHIGSNRMVAHSFDMDLGINIAHRKGPGPNNKLGMVRKAPNPAKLTCSVSFGGLTAPQEITAALEATYQGAQPYSVGTQDVSLQIGDQSGAIWLIRIPAARIMVVGRSDDEGLEQVQLEMTAVQSPNHANVPGSYRIHVG